MWIEAVSTLISILTNTSKLIKTIKDFGKHIFYKDFTIKDIKKSLNQASLEIGDEVHVIGLYSDYMPFVDLRTLLPKEYYPFHIFSSQFDSINNIKCCALFSPEAKGCSKFTRSPATTRTFELTGGDTISVKFNSEHSPNESMIESVPCVPIFFSKFPSTSKDKGNRLANYTTGEILELKCKICEIPDEWRKLIIPSDSFRYSTVGGVQRPFGLRVFDVDIYGLADFFFINTWIVGHAKTSSDFESLVKESLETDLKRQAKHKHIPLTRKETTARKISHGLLSHMLAEGGTFVNPVVPGEFVRKSESEFPLTISQGLSSPNLIEYVAENVNVMDSHEHTVMRETLDQLAEMHNNIIWDFQYDQVNKVRPQSIKIGELTL